MGGRRPLPEQTVVTLDHDCTNLVYVTNIRARHQSRSVHKYSMTSQISLSSEVFEYFTHLVEAERHLKNNCGGPQGRSAQHPVVTLDHEVTNLVYVADIRLRHTSR